jgi:hypothetical protein
VAYQGRVLVSILALVPAMLRKLKKERIPPVSKKAQERLTAWLREVAERAKLLQDGVHHALNLPIDSEIGDRIRNSLWLISILTSLR